MMNLGSTHFRTVVSQAAPNLSNQSRRSRRRTSSSPPQCVLLTAPAPVCGSFSGRRVSAAVSPLRFIPKLGHLAQLAPTTTTSTEKNLLGSAEESVRMATPANCSSVVEPLVGQVSAPARVFGGFIASLLTTAAGLLGSAGNLNQGDIQGGRSEGGEEPVGSGKDLLQLGFTLVTPAASSGGFWWPQSALAMQDIYAGVVTVAGALAYLEVFNQLAKRNVLEKKLSRKLVHIGVGLGFMLFWPLYTASTIAPYLAAFAPAMNGVRMLLIGSGLMPNDAVVNAMTREGDPRELLKGPFYYAVSVVVTTVGFWRTSPVGIVALVNLCAGDGFADLIGRNFGKRKLPYNQDKSWAGSVGFFVMSTLISMLYLRYFSAFGFLEILPGTYLGVALVSFLTALVESLPISTRLDDNFTVSFTAIVLGIFLLPVS